MDPLRIGRGVVLGNLHAGELGWHIQFAVDGLRDRIGGHPERSFRSLRGSNLFNPGKSRKRSRARAGARSNTDRWSGPASLGELREGQVALPVASVAAVREKRLQRFMIDRLRQMKVESGIPRSPAIVFTGVARDRNQNAFLQLGH